MASLEEDACPVCRTPYRLEPEDVDHERALLQCHACGTQQDLNSFGGDVQFALMFVRVLEESQRPVPCTPPPPRPSLPLPPGFQWEEDTHHTVLSWRGLGGLRLTRITATRDALTVHVRLLGSTRKHLRLERRDLVQLYGQAHAGFLGERYRLCALTRRGRRVILVSGFPHKEPVLYLEQTLERRLGIEDSWVKGELAERPPPESWAQPWGSLTVRLPLEEAPGGKNDPVEGEGRNGGDEEGR